MLLMKINWQAPLDFQIPAGTKYSSHGWVLVDLPMSQFNPDLVLKYRIQEVNDPQMLDNLKDIDYTVLNTSGKVVKITSIVDVNPDTLDEDHLSHFPELAGENLAEFIAGIKYLSKLEIQNKYDRLFAALSPTHSALEAATWTQQLAEATAYQGNPSYPTPLLSTLSQASGLSISELAQRAIEQNSAYESSKTNLLAQMLDDQVAVDNCQTAHEVEQLGWLGDI